MALKSPSVSYTHLDVYKRQALDHGVQQDDGSFPSFQGEAFFPHEVLAQEFLKQFRPAEMEEGFSRCV